MKLLIIMGMKRERGADGNHKGKEISNLQVIEQSPIDLIILRLMPIQNVLFWVLYS